ncbi:metal-dependent transcriptional regulator [Pseudoclavibacter caeni]|uniref:Manganese transport regulator n=1 Tax=Pseudoclavibacter caeni TaxID=908846 RepID=A0A7C8FSB6_9MICO|nr:metal-dependent transcriptional regulator [Pseudoclavibacter caeni]KAB1631694.1 metal-dependent transcriptional regulator [Pseudoclavibacter caeni]NYJ97321.1 DtxR family Mn-dependent transcriptional regulator [Pseudoclavibacter caeni]
MPTADHTLSQTNEDYLKVIWEFSEWSGAPITPGHLAERMGLTRSTVSEGVRRLTDLGLVEHERYGTVALTPEGERTAVRMVRCHRILETFLVSYLGYDWDEVHEEAEVLEHAVSARMIERLDARLNHPVRDPHGDPIPRADGTIPALEARPLSEVPAGHTVTVRRVNDDNPELLRYLATIGLHLDSTLTVLDRVEVAGTMRLLLGDRQLDIGIPAARGILVAD